MDNFTRDPFHNFVATHYAKNINKLKVYVDGELIEPHRILSVYQRTTAGSQYVVLFDVDINDQIVEDEIIKTNLDYKGREITHSRVPKTRKLYGDITVEGEPKNCTCWEQKQISHWWRKVNAKRPGW